MQWRLDRDHDGLGPGRLYGRHGQRAIQRRPPQSGGDDRPGGGREISRGQGPPVPRRPVPRRLAAGALLVWLFYKDHYDISTDPGTILGTFATGPAIRSPLRNVLSEVIGTFVLLMAVLYAASPKIAMTGGEVKIGLGSLGAIPVAFVVIGIGLSLGGTTGYAINPARDLGPRLIHYLVPIPNKGTSDWGYSWVPIVGPILGALLAASIS